MKELTIQIQENKLPFIVELLNNFDFVKIIEDYYIPDSHKEIVRKRIKTQTEKPELLLDWEKIQHEL